MMNRNFIHSSVDSLVTSIAKHQHLNENDHFNPIGALQEFWNMRIGFEQSNENANITYEYLETSGPPYICTVTLPGGACFGTFQNCATKSDARRSAALIGLMNSVFNEQPSRRITKEFIEKSVFSVMVETNSGNEKSIELYVTLLESNLGKTILEFNQMMTIFQILHWNGSFKAMKQRQCTRDEVIAYYKHKVIDQDMRIQISLDWIIREQECPGTINRELHQTNNEIEMARCTGKELRFLKEKRDILLLALFQIDVEINIA